jgi:hypothetical protein
VKARELEQHGDGREPDGEWDAETRPSGRECCGNQRGAQRMTARPRRVERDEMGAVPVDRGPRQSVPEHELDADGEEPGGGTRRAAQLRGGRDHEQERDGDLPRQGHDLGHCGSERMELRVQ